MDGDEISGTIGDDSDQAAAGKNIQQEKNVGGQAASNVFIYPPSTPSTSKPRRKRPKQQPPKAPRMEDIEITLRKLIAQVEIRVDDLEGKLRRNERYSDDEFDTIRQALKDLRNATRPLDGQGILSAPQPAADPESIKRSEEHNRRIVGMVRIGLIIAGVVGGSIIILVLAIAFRVFGGA